MGCLRRLHVGVRNKHSGGALRDASTGLGKMPSERGGYGAVALRGEETL
jgi:hypothetical protein